MITHIVCWKYKTDVTEEQRAEHLARLRALPGLIPYILSFSAGSDVLRLDRSFDTALVATFANLTDLEAYNEHPEHQAVVLLGKELSERAVSVDFETD